MITALKLRLLKTYNNENNNKSNRQTNNARPQPISGGGLIPNHI